MKKFLKNAIVFFIALIMFVLLSNTTKAAEVTDAEKSKILEFIEANNQALLCTKIISAYSCWYQ